MNLFDTVRAKKIRLTEVYRNTNGLDYIRTLRYSKQEKPMTAGWEKISAWHEIRRACNKLGIEWDGFAVLPPDPADDDF